MQPFKSANPFFIISTLKVIQAMATDFTFFSSVYIFAPNRGYVLVIQNSYELLSIYSSFQSPIKHSGVLRLKKTGQVFQALFYLATVRTLCQRGSYRSVILELLSIASLESRRPFSSKFCMADHFNSSLCFSIYAMKKNWTQEARIW